LGDIRHRVFAQNEVRRGLALMKVLVSADSYIVGTRVL
jgi:hypothetical protein